MLRFAALLLVIAAWTAMPARADIPPPYDPYGIGATLADAQPYVRVATVAPGSPAEQAGLKVGDGIIAIDGYVRGTVPFYYFARGLQGPQNSKVELIVLRDDRQAIFMKIVRSVRIRR